MELIHPPLLSQIKAFMDRSLRRQEIISSNLANVDTPGYRAKRLEFSRILRTQRGDHWMDPSSSKFSSSVSRLHSRIDRKGVAGSLGNDRNNVNLEAEMTELAQNLLKFSIVSEIYQKEIQMIRSGIREGRS